MDAAEARVVAMLATERITWADYSMACPGGLYVCDCAYHDEAVLFKTTTHVRNVGFVFDETNDGRIVFSVIQHSPEFELSEVCYDADYTADTGGILLLNGPVVTQARSDAISETMQTGLPKGRLVVDGSRIYGPSRCGAEECFFIDAGWGSGGYEVFNSPTCHVLDHRHVRWYLKA